MRAVVAVFALALATTGCAELGVVTDGTSISYGRPSRGRLIDGVRLPDEGRGFTTREVWAQRGNRFGTHELVALLKNVAKRVHKRKTDVRLVVADLSDNGGGAALKFHKSHQSGRDVDLLYFMRGPDGKPLEADAMRVFDSRGVARDGSGITIDVPRNWALVRELLTANEAYVQYIFIYRPIAEMLIAHAQKTNEDPVVIARAMRALKQPGDSAPHHDHMHVRIYCAAADRQFGCVDIGPQELLAERELERANLLETVAQALPPPQPDGETGDEPALLGESAADVWAATATPKRAPVAIAPASDVGRKPPPLSAPPIASPSLPAITAGAFNSLLRGARANRIDLRSWR